ncbi:hypothetical protein HOE425_332550 [Hoeflea sp. EC-HK425]|nr:hypothetical protein HOE425_332550 [Hoeflea sp. EC-HK425]
MAVRTWRAARRWQERSSLRQTNGMDHAFRATGRAGNDANGATEPVATAPRLQPDAQRTL